MTQTIRKTTTYIIGKGTVVARKKLSKAADPAEIARKRREREALTRATPSEWGLNEEARALPQNASIHVTAQTRQKTARAQRYDCFAILAIRGALGSDHDQNLARLASVRRFEDTMAERMRLDGLPPSSGTSGGRPIPISDRSLMAADCLAFIERSMLPSQHGLLLKLVEPSVTAGQPVNNWRHVVQTHTGEHYHTAQASLVRAAAESLLQAWQGWDQRERRAA